MLNALRVSHLSLILFSIFISYYCYFLSEDIKAKRGCFLKMSAGIYKQATKTNNK